MLFSFTFGLVPGHNYFPPHFLTYTYIFIYLFIYLYLHFQAAQFCSLSELPTNPGSEILFTAGVPWFFY